MQALKGVSLHVEEGEVVSLIGANGAGKTTLLNSIWDWFPPEPDRFFSLILILYSEIPGR